VSGKVRAVNAPRRDLSAPSPAELARVMLRLKDSLTTEMLQNFELFLYVSKADSGPLAQRMYVFRKQASGDLNLLYNWPASTGRELVEFAPNGQRAPSFTPQGYYGPILVASLHHVSGQWGRRCRPRVIRLGDQRRPDGGATARGRRHRAAQACDASPCARTGAALLFA
jgi:hypothetical protein